MTYPNNNKLVKQKVTINKELFVEKVEVLNENDEVEMTFTIRNTDYNPTFDESYFEVNSIINSTNNNQLDNNKETTSKNDIQNNNSSSSTSETTKPNCNENDVNCQKEENNIKQENNNISSKIEVKRLTMTKNGTEDKENLKEDTTKKSTSPTASLEDVIYPLYLPTGTVLKDQEKVSKTDGERVILTFAGDKGFTLVEETAVKEKEFTIVPTYGEPGFVNDTIGAITDNSLNWISNGVEYYMVSDVMNTIELLDIANSINVTAVSNLK